LEIISPIFPGLGKFHAQLFQALEKPAPFFPSPGKFRADFSKAWNAGPVT
jgi:hypothetical protein